jgi:hypothetical protein
MGTPTAHMCYGLPIPNNSDLFKKVWNYEMGFDEYCMGKLSIDIYGKFGCLNGYDFDKYNEKRKYALILYADESLIVIDYSYKDYPPKLGNIIQAKPKWREDLKDLCEKLEIEFTEPEFLLTCIWGNI